MTLSPDRVFARVVLAAVVLIGFLGLAALVLLALGAGPDRWGTLSLRCLVAPMSALDTAVHGSAVTLATIAGLAVLAGMRAGNRERAAVAELRSATTWARLGSPPPRMLAAATAVGVAGRVDVVVAPRPFAFAYGWFRPRICVSTGLIDRLTDEELKAVLHHEGWHVARRDPLRLLMVRTVGAAFTVVPPIRRLVRLYVLAVEVAADRHVVAAMGNPRWLASALIKVTEPPVAGPAFEGHAEARVAALAGDPLPSLPSTPWRGHVAAAALVLELFAVIPLLTGGGLPLLASFWMHPAC